MLHTRTLTWPSVAALALMPSFGCSGEPAAEAHGLSGAPTGNLGTPMGAVTATGTTTGTFPGAMAAAGAASFGGAPTNNAPPLVSRGDGTFNDVAGNITTADGTVLLSNNGDGTYSAPDGTVVVVDANGVVTTPDGTVLLDSDNDGIPDIVDDKIGMAVDPTRPEIQASELEDDSTFLAPVTTGGIIWSANPTSGRVALIDAATREVRTVTAGLRPTYLTAIPSSDDVRRTAVINVGNATATLFEETDESGVSELTIELQDDANAWTVSAGGRWAVAWSNHRRVERDLATAEGLQDVTVIDLSEDPPRTTRLAVGYRPVKLEITEDETTAFAVTGQGITPIELGDSPRSSDDVLVDLPEGVQVVGYAPEDVAITRDGKFALVRHAGTNVASIVDLEQRRQVDLEFASDVTDLDLSSDGSSGIVVLRQTSEVVVFELEEIIEDTTAITVVGFGDEVVGSAVVAEQGNTAVLFTNAVPNDRVSVLQLGDDDITKRTVSLRVPVRNVFASPDASHAVAFLSPEEGSRPPGAFAIVPLQTNLPPKTVATEGQPVAVALSETAAGVRGLVTVQDASTGVYQVHVLQMPSLQTDVVALPSPPIATGILPSENLGYVAQSHPEGLITFIDLTSGSTQTLTGFELAARVVDGSER